MPKTPETTPEKKHWLVRPETIRRLTWLAVAVLAVVAVLDFAIGRYAGFGIDGTVFFYSWYGFATCVAMIVMAKLVGVLVKRKDSYYDD